MPSDDIADFVLLHRSGVRSAIHLDYVTRPAVRRSRIVGAEGSLEIDLLARTLVRFYSDGRIAEDNRYPGSFAEDYMTEIDAFLDRMAGRPMTGAAGEEGLRALEIAIEVRRKAGLPQ
jgi:predicted dehydrogenase